MKVSRLLTPRRTSYARITGGALWGAWLLSILLGSGNMDLANQVVGTDYIQFYAAGLTIRMGESPKLYDFEFQSQLEQNIIGPELTNFHAFITPPFLAWLYTPLSLLPYIWSFSLWSLFGLAGLWISLRWLGLKSPRKPFTWALTWFPIFATISFGQNSLLSLVILSLTYYLTRRGKLIAAGCTSSLLLYKPQLLLGTGILWILEWRHAWKALLGFALGSIVLISMSLWLLPEASQAYIQLSRTILPELINWKTFPLWHSHSLRGFWTLLIPDQHLLAEVLAILFSIGGLIIFVHFWLQNKGQLPILFAGAICLTLWVTPHAMIYDWVLLVIPATFLWELIPEQRQRFQAIYALIWVVTLVSGPLTYVQMKVLPIAIQISIPVFLIALWSIITTDKQLIPE